jgi:hypothetical protein
MHPVTVRCSLLACEPSVFGVLVVGRCGVAWDSPPGRGESLGVRVVCASSPIVAAQTIAVVVPVQIFIFSRMNLPSI